MTCMTDDAAAALEPYRKYLLVLAQLHLDAQLRGKLDPADLVQQTLLRAHVSFDSLRQREPGVIAAWLRSILARTLADAARYYDAGRRAVDLERSLEAQLDRSSSGMASWLAADQTSPSERAAHNEDLLRLADALAELPENQREVVSLKHLQGKPLQEIADDTGRSLAATAGLLRRGLEGLRELMQEKN
jgi:RNA polymerase sigma-70 factor (ECF subfamily)